MKLVSRLPLAALATLCVALTLPLACNSDTGGDLDTDTETNWLKACEDDGMCGNYTCECGVCTTRCEATAECAMHGAVCSSATDEAYRALCGESSSGGLCVSEQAAAGDDDTSGNAPEGNDDGPSTTGDDVATEPTPQPEPTVTEPAAEPTAPAPDPVEPTVDPLAQPAVSSDSGVTTPRQPQDAGSPLADTPDSGSEASACSRLDRGALMGGCCFDESDCPTEQHCYQQDCSSEPPTPGRCGAPPPDGCFADSDCGPGERCNGGQLAVCGSLAPDGLGACEPLAAELLQGYVLWDRPGGVAGTGPILELVEDGTLHLWMNSSPYSPRGTSDWDFETELAPERSDEIVRLLLAVDATDLPHDTPFTECYPSLYFEGPRGEVMDLEYGGAVGLLPEMQDVYDWFDALLLDVAPEFVAPSQYCATLP